MKDIRRHLGCLSTFLNNEGVMDLFPPSKYSLNKVVSGFVSFSEGSRNIGVSTKRPPGEWCGWIAITSTGKNEITAAPKTIKYPFLRLVIET